MPSLVILQGDDRNIVFNYLGWKEKEKLGLKRGKTEDGIEEIEDGKRGQ